MEKLEGQIHSFNLPEFEISPARDPKVTITLFMQNPTTTTSRDNNAHFIKQSQSWWWFNDNQNSIYIKSNSLRARNLANSKTFLVTTDVI